MSEQTIKELLIAKSPFKTQSTSTTRVATCDCALQNTVSCCVYELRTAFHNLIALKIKCKLVLINYYSVPFLS